MEKTSFIENHQLKQLLRMISVNGEFPVYNMALLTCADGIGLRLTELARLPIKAYLRFNGTVLVESAVTADIAYKNDSERPLFWSTVKFVTAIGIYHEYRVEHRHCTTTTRKTAYRGIDLEAPIFLKGEGRHYELMKRCTTTTVIIYLRDSLSQLLRKLHFQAGIEGACVMSGRRMFDVPLARNHIDSKNIKVLLGMRTLRPIKALIDAHSVRLGAIASGVF